MRTPPEQDRLDRWLFHARLFRSRALAAAAAELGRVRINGRKVRKPAATVRSGDVVTVVQAGRVRVLRIAALAVRRGPAVEAQALYADITPADGEDFPF